MFPSSTASMLLSAVSALSLGDCSTCSVAKFVQEMETKLDIDGAADTTADDGMVLLDDSKEYSTSPDSTLPNTTEVDTTPGTEETPSVSSSSPPVNEEEVDPLSGGFVHEYLTEYPDFSSA